MTLKEDVLEMKNEVKDIKKESFAMELLKDQRKQNKRLFIIILVLIFAFVIETGYLVWLLNDIGTETTTTETKTYGQDIDDIGDMSNSNIVNGGDIIGKD